MRYKIWLPLLFVSLILFSCNKEEEDTITEKPIYKAKYLHISHTRTTFIPKMDSIAEKIDYSKYDMLWLGGDLIYLTSENHLAMQYVDSVFSVGNENTLWSLGHHDYTNLDLLEQYTHRPAYYSYFKNGITFIVLDTRDNLSNITGLQKEFFDSVMDTIENSSHLIILHHKLIWLYGNPDLEYQISDIANGIYGTCLYCTNPNNFYETIYPRLLEIKNKGIGVICVAGDIGYRVKEFSYTTNDDIYFLASGIYYDSIGNKALVFNHNITTKELEWEYVLLEDL